MYSRRRTAPGLALPGIIIYAFAVMSCSLLRVFAPCLLISADLAAQGIITTIAGTDLYTSRRMQPALEAPLGEVSGSVVDRNGSVFFCDRRTQQVFRLSADGSLTVVAGNGISGFPDRTIQFALPFPAVDTFGGDGGLAVSALLNDPTAVAVDTDGTLYIADRINQRIRRVTPDGTISTYAGGGKPTSGNGDGGPALLASFSDPFGVALDSSGNLYVSDVTANNIRRITRSGLITTFAGKGATPATTLRYPAHLAFSNGFLYVAELSAQRISRIGADGVVNAVVGKGTQGFSGDNGPALSAQLNNPAGIAIDDAGTIYIADTGNGRVRSVSNGTIRTIAGTGQLASGGDGGAAISADLLLPTAVAVDRSGTVYIASARTGRLRRVKPDGKMDTVAGNGARSAVAASGPALNATLNLGIDTPCQGYDGESRIIGTYPGLASDSVGNVYFAEPSSNWVRRITPTGLIEVAAGNGTAGLSGDGKPATQAALNGPITVATGPGKSIFIIDSNNTRLRYVDDAGLMNSGFNIGGIDAANNLQLDTFLLPRDRIVIGAKLAVDSTGVLYTVLGSSIFRTTPGASTATINTGLQTGGGNVPLHIALDPTGVLYAATQLRVFRVSASGTTTPVAGTGARGNSGDGGPATAATFQTINSIAFDTKGNLYISDFAPGVIRRVGTDGKISRVAGSGACGNSGDGGFATDAALDPRAITVDGLGRLLIMSADRIRAVLPNAPQFTTTPASLAFAGLSTGAPTQPQNLVLSAVVPGMAFTAKIEPPSDWLQLSTTSGQSPRLVGVTADPASLKPGRYAATVVIDTPGALPVQARIPVTFDVGPAAPVSLGFDRNGLTFFIPKSGGPRSETILVRNAGGGDAVVSVSLTYGTPGSWLSVTPNGATATPRKPAALAVSVNPAGLAAGTYTATISVSQAGSRPVALPVILLVSDRDQAMSLTQAGVSFTAVQDGGVVPPQTFGVANAGVGTFSWDVSTSTESGGTTWLLAAPTKGSTTARQVVPTVEISVAPKNLAPGRYYGLVTVNSQGAPNAPQVVTVFLEVLPRGSNPGAVLVPGQVQFQAGVGSQSAAAQDVLVYNLSATPVTFTTSVSVSPGKRWIRVLPLTGTVLPTEPSRFTAQTLLRDLFDGSVLSPGDYRADMTFQFSDGVVRSVPLRYTVSPAGSATAQPESLGAAKTADPTNCVPAKLIPAWRSIGQSFGGSAGWPIAMDVEVRDDCGQALAAGSVVVSFSNGDAPLPLQPLIDGHWQGTWQAAVQPNSVTVRVEASSADAALKGSLETAAALSASQDPPDFASDAVVSAASGVRLAPLAPRAYISIFGQRLAGAAQFGLSTPLPQRLGDTEVVMSGQRLPLTFVGPGQINAVVPQNLPVNTTHQIYVRRGATLSRPVTVSVAPAQPAFFADAQGRALAAAVRVEGGVQRVFTPSPATPVQAGDTVVFYLSGLGGVSGALGTGEASPSNPLLRVSDPVKVFIGGKEAPVAFAGLAPGFVALYQVNAVVPDGASVGDASTVTITAGGQVSPAVLIAVR